MLATRERILGVDVDQDGQTLRRGVRRGRPDVHEDVRLHRADEGQQ